jgi:4-alpha-glucanotransferase
VAIRHARVELAPQIRQQQFWQYLFFRQLEMLRSHARKMGVRLLGDLPIFVAFESADVWAHQDLFQLDRRGQPKVVAGVPPDMFSATGQLWGNPLYDWPAMKQDGYRWWIARLAMMQKQFDAVRIDHFRGFSAYWAVPAQKSDARKGRWRPGPGIALFEAAERQLGELPLVAEDLGLITPDVDALRRQAGIPGMAVLQFAYDGNPANRYLSHNHTRDLVVYPGTHDNDSVPNWFADLPRQRRKYVEAYLPRVAEDPAWTLIEEAWSSAACCAIVQLQDLLGLRGDGRMNQP